MAHFVFRFKWIYSLVNNISNTNTLTQIGIHIADVASVVPPGSSVDEEARERATSFYSGSELN